MAKRDTLAAKLAKAEARLLMARGLEPDEAHELRVEINRMANELRAIDAQDAP